MAASLLTELSPQRGTLFGRLTTTNNVNNNNDDDSNKLKMTAIKGFNVIRKPLEFQRIYKVMVVLKEGDFSLCRA